MTDNAVLDIGYLDTLPPEWETDLLSDIRKKIGKSNAKVVILDDDPTGTQTVRDLPVLTHWSEQALCEELTGRYPAFFILTNSRSLPESGACKLAHEIGTLLRRASELTGIRTVVISRSDSTLRGHFPAEVDEMARVMGKEKLPYLILPFFLEGGRYTLNDIHYVREGEQLIPAALTPFARDAAFGFRHSNLRQWVEEKTRGKIGAAGVTSISLDDIRLGGPDRVAKILLGVPPAGACIVNAAGYRDMEVLVSALLDVESSGKEFLCRTAASFVRTRTGMDHREALLTKEDLTSGSRHGGLFVIGSYVEKTSRQVKALFAKTDIATIEVRVNALLDPAKNGSEITRVAEETSAALTVGRDTAVYHQQGTDLRQGCRIQPQYRADGKRRAHRDRPTDQRSTALPGGKRRYHLKRCRHQRAWGQAGNDPRTGPAGGSRLEIGKRDAISGDGLHCLSGKCRR